VAGVLALLRWRRLAWIVMMLAILETLVMAFPPVSDALILPLERQARLEAAGAPSCCYDAIVVLGGGVAPAVPPFQPEPDLTESADRIWYAAKLYHRGVAARVFVSGGSFLADTNGGPATTEAEAMRRFLKDLGVPDQAIVEEGTSLNTIQNIERVKEMVKGGRVALVTSAFHLPRAMRLARRYGLNAAAFPTDWYVPPEARAWWDNWIPSVSAMGWSVIGLRELLAAWFDWRGRGS
jgi:uncharacterized SAM-binding protein YcdF (DUF218 family)